MYQDGSSKAAESGLVRPVHSSDVFVKDVSLHTQPVVRYARCCGEAQLELVSIYLETPYVTTYRVSFEGLTKATGRAPSTCHCGGSVRSAVMDLSSLVSGSDGNCG